MKNHILLFIAFLACITGYSQSTKIIGSAPVQYVTSNRPATKPDLTLYASNNTEADLSALGDSLGGRNMVTLIITKPTGVSVNPSFPAITDTLLGTKIKVKTYFETSSEQIGIFQSDLGFVTGYDGTAYTDNGTILFVQDLEEFTLWPVEDVNGLHWAYTKTSGTDADGNGIISALPLGDVTIVGATSSDLRIQNTRTQLDGKFKVGADSSFVHDPAQDTTFQKGTAVFGKASLLGPYATSGVPFVFRNSNTASTYMLIESGRDLLVGGEATLNLKSSGGWSEGIQFYNDLSLYSYKNSRVNMKIGSNSAFPAGKRTLIAGYIDDPSQWGLSATLVVYDTITVGKALFVAKKVSSSSTPIATFSSGANDRLIVNDNGDIQINSAYLLAKTAPSATSTVKSFMTWTGTGSGATPAFETVNSAITGTARIIPYMNSSGRFVTGNTYFKLDTTTTSGAQARVRLLINNPNGDAGEGDSYSALSVRAGDGLGTEAIFNIGDQAATMGTTGYGSVFQLSRSGGNFTTKTNLSNGNEVGKFAWRGYVNSGSRALGHIQLNYVGDGTTINSDLLGASAVSGSVVSGWKLDNQSRFWLGSGADDYYFPTIAPSNTNLAKNILIWTGTGSAPATPAWGTITGLMVDGQFTTGTPTLTAFGTGSYQRYTAVVELTSGASANTDIPLPTADATSYGKSILLSPRDLNTSYNINATGSIELGGASTATMHLTKPTEFVCNIVGTGPTTYRWVVVDNATNDKGSSSASTDGSGDVVITHNKNHTNYVVGIQGTGATLGVGYTVIAKTATTFTVRAYDTSTKAAITSTAVTFDWIIKE
jgi:hypothetical protein